MPLAPTGTLAGQKRAIQACHRRQQHAWPGAARVPADNLSIRYTAGRTLLAAVIPAWASMARLVPGTSGRRGQPARLRDRASRPAGATAAASPAPAGAGRGLIIG